ncbi:hypothetical protein [Rhizobium leguminosarum]|uniref:Uncharacterized protein n=1 Tax=Rhizobium leguminosarum TaxID=384 RepID=A0A7W9ZRJ6_RHILE|nr:hypothetical protein [Rhizobium leguminosarum]MBB6220189.1 hypothetical protein [Rhizobium leguminosarum]
MMTTIRNDSGSLDLAIEGKARPRHIEHLCNVTHSRHGVTDF